MSRRARALGFAAAAAVCAGLAAAATGAGPDRMEAGYGELREVVVAARPLARGERLKRPQVAEALELRRVPERFVPPAALSDPAQALGRSVAAPVPAGAYVLDAQLAVPGAGDERERPLPSGRQPVEITVEAAGALADAAEPGGAGPVDVVVTTEPGPGGGSGRTYLAARAVMLLGLRPAGRGASPEDALAGSAAGTWIATLALTRAQALELIQAESFARGIRLIGR